MTFPCLKILKIGFICPSPFYLSQKRSGKCVQKKTYPCLTHYRGHANARNTTQRQEHVHIQTHLDKRMVFHEIWRFPIIPSLEDNVIFKICSNCYFVKLLLSFQHLSQNSILKQIFQTRYPVFARKFPASAVPFQSASVPFSGSNTILNGLKRQFSHFGSKKTDFFQYRKGRRKAVELRFRNGRCIGKRRQDAARLHPAAGRRVPESRLRTSALRRSNNSGAARQRRCRGTAGAVLPAAGT